MSLVPQQTHVNTEEGPRELLLPKVKSRRRVAAPSETLLLANHQINSLMFVNLNRQK